MKKITIDETRCIGCGACQATAPEVYEVIDGLAVVKEENINEKNYDDVVDAATGCPVDAIIIDNEEEEKAA